MPRADLRVLVKVAFASGSPELNPKLVDRLADIYPELPLYVVSEFAPHRGEWIPYHPHRSWNENMAVCREALAGHKIRLAAVLLVPRMPYWRMRMMALRLSVRGFLAYNENLDSFMLRPRSLPGILRHLIWRTTNFFRWHLRAENPWRTNPRWKAQALACWWAGWAFAFRPRSKGGVGEVPAQREMPTEARRAFEQVPDLFCATGGIDREPMAGEDLSYVLFGGEACSWFDPEKLRELGGFSAAYGPGRARDMDLGNRAWLRRWPSVFVAGLGGERPDALGRERLRFAASTGSRKVWQEAVEDADALEGAWKLPFLTPIIGNLDERTLALCGGDVAVFPGHERRGLPVVLIATAYLPFPLAHGGAVRIFNLMRRAHEDFDQVMVAFCDRPATPPAELLAICAEIILVNRKGTHYRISSPRPDMVEEMDSPAFHGALLQNVKKWRPAVAQLEFTPMAQYAEDCSPAKTVLVEHDITFDLHEQLARTEPKWEARQQLEKWRAFEQGIWRKFDRVVTMSAKDRETVGLASALCLPNGVDLSRFQPVSGREEPGRVLFIGSFTHLPNLLALEFFLNEVWRQLDDLSPVLHVIAGARHEYYLDFYRKKIEAPRLEMEGFVSDVRGAYTRASVVIAPLTASAGTNIKILEAMAMGKAIVSTPAGINGLDVEEGVMVARDAAEFATAVRTFLEDEATRLGFGLRARSIAERDYGWDEIGRRQRVMYDELIGNPSGRSDTPR